MILDYPGYQARAYVSNVHAKEKSNLQKPLFTMATLSGRARIFHSGERLILVPFS